MTRTVRRSQGSHARDRYSAPLVVSTLALAFLVVVPAVTWAQSGIAGVVKDTSGAVMPGVTVEAASPALIEKVRTAVTDDQGRYNIVDLRPGVYAVTFTLAGFNTVRREGIELPSSFTATVNAELPVGALEETLTVTGEAPVVDVQSSAQQKTLSKELLEAVPTGRYPQSYTTLIAGATQSAETFGVGLPNSFQQAAASFHGIDDSQLSADGFETRHVNVVSTAQYSMNQGTIQEIVVSASGAGADQQGGGLVTNAIPKEGSNTFRGQVYFHYTNEHFLGNNLTDALRAVGATTQSIRKQWDVNPGVGGPLAKDRLWFFASWRYTGTAVDSGSRFDVNPLDWVYTPDLSRPAASEKQVDHNHSVRLTWQATPRNKVSAYYDYQPKDWYNRAINAKVAPEVSEWAPYNPQYLTQLVWKSLVNNRLLLEAGTSYQLTRLNINPNDHEATFGGPVSPSLSAVSATDLSTGIRFRGPYENGFWHLSRSLRSRAAASYVTGTHAFKVGMDISQGWRLVDNTPPNDYTVQVRNGVPVSLTLYGRQRYASRQKADVGLYAQDQWTLRRATINAGVRYDYFIGYTPGQDVPANRFLPARHFDAVEGVPRWHNLSPRLGVSYNVFGDGKTALKVNLNRYVAVEGTGTIDANNPVVTSVLSANRNWTDSNGNFIPDCDFTNSAANGECGVLSDLNFGQNNPRATRYDSAYLRGFGVRRYNWEGSASIQHELLRGLAVTAGYYRRWFGNLIATDNQLVTPADYDPYCVTVPVDSRLPGGGGNQLCGFYDVSPTKFGQVQNLVTFASTYSGARSQVYNGMDVTISLRFPSGAQLSGGTSTGRTETVNCQVIDSPGGTPGTGQSSNTLAFCDIKPPFQTQVKLLGVYPLPWYGIQVSGALQSVPGPEISTTDYVFTNNDVKGSLGRNLSSGANGTVTLPLMARGTSYGKQFNKLDVRLSKMVRIGRNRLTGSVDIFNFFNGAGVVQVNTRYGPAWLNPVQVLGARLFRLSGQIDF